jgi:hypothetical protein
MGNFQFAIQLEISYILEMIDLRELVAERMEQLGNPSPFTLAREHGLERGFINDILIGKKKRVLDLTKLAAALEVDAGAMSKGKLVPVMADDEHTGTVPLVGYVGAGAEAHFYAVSQGELERVPAPENSTPDTVAAEIRGESLGALFQHWLVYYDDVRSPITPDLLGKLCVVGLPDDRVLVKQIKAAKTPGLYDLLSNTEDPIKGAVVLWAAKVNSMVPR